MKREPNHKIDRFRKEHPSLGKSPKGASYGYFERGRLRIISGGIGDEWEHVSVSCEDRVPMWGEMCAVKQMFWYDSETVIQFHPRKSEYINKMPFCLHLWKRRGENHPLPPELLI